MGQIRIIGGQWRRTPIAVPDRPGLRPTPDRVRETLFNWLQSLLGPGLGGARVLDAFAGSGALGIEAASRGASDVTMVERDAVAISGIRSLISRLGAQGVQVRQADAAAFMASEPAGCYGLIFLDPPFHGDWLARLLPEAHRLLTEEGLVYVESETPIDLLVSPDDRLPFEILRQGRAGAVFHGLLCSKPSERKLEAGQ